MFEKLFATVIQLNIRKTPQCATCQPKDPHPAPAEPSFLLHMPMLPTGCECTTQSLVDGMHPTEIVTASEEDICACGMELEVARKRSVTQLNANILQLYFIFAVVISMMPSCDSRCSSHLVFCFAATRITCAQSSSILVKLAVPGITLHG